MPEYYHLDTCFCPLENGELLLHEPAFTDEGLDLITASFGAENLIRADSADAAAFVCNAINVGDQIICNKISAPLRQELEHRGYTVTETPMSEFLLSGGSTKCCVLHLTAYGQDGFKPWTK